MGNFLKNHLCHNQIPFKTFMQVPALFYYGMFGMEGEERRWEGWLEYTRISSQPKHWVNKKFNIKRKRKYHGPSMKKCSTHNIHRNDKLVIVVIR